MRVKSDAYDRMAQKIRPEDFAKITGVVYEISALPAWMSEEALGEFLSPSNTLLEVKRVERTGWGEQERRSFYVKTCGPIAWTRKQGDTFVATCKVSERRQKKTTLAPTYRPAVSQSAFPRLTTKAPEPSTDVQMQSSEGRNVRPRVQNLQQQPDVLAVQNQVQQATPGILRR